MEKSTSTPPCADDGKHIKAKRHYTEDTDGLIREWEGRVFMNPPYSQPAVWMDKLQAEIKLERVTEAIALVPAATDTKWLSPVLKSQPVCFWTGRIKFLSEDYQPRNSARQSHVLVYWALRSEWFKKVFEPHGVVYLPASLNVNSNTAIHDAVLPVEGTSSTNLKTDIEIVLPVGRTSSTCLRNDLHRVLPVKRTSSTNMKTDMETVLPVGRTSSTHLKKDSHLVLPVEPTNSTNIKIDMEMVLPAGRTSSIKRRSYGEGTGRIHWRTITKKNGKQYQQPWYDWQFKSGKKTFSKSTYIP